MELGLIGAGNMARALARGWGKPVLCTDPGGTTSRGPAALDRGGLRAAFHEAIDAAMEPA